MPTCSWLDVLSDHIWDNDVVNRNWFTTNITTAPDKVEIQATATPPAAYRLPEISQVIFNEASATTVLIWADGQKTVVRCGEGETFDRYTGFMAAICKRLFGGTTTAKKLMNSIDKQYQAKLKAEKEAEEKAKRIAEMEEAKKKADARRAKEDAMVMEAMVNHYLMEAEAKRRAAEILADKAKEKEEEEP